ncbi:hypothetical protein DFH06DRAFT_110839 [Mycena polygramma]|nr:hypothetical protein DFH06DRAFT_110839 [Mycena polygramma]
MSATSIHSILSLDLILEILDSLAVPLHFHQRSCDLSVLAACSTVCKGWSAHAQRLLFRRVILPANIYREPHLRGTTRNLVPSFLAATDPATERGRWLAESVVSLTMRHTGRSLTSEPTWLATALLRTPNLRHLDVTTIFFDADALLRLREFGPRITSLCILQDFSPAAILRAPPLSEIVASFPSIRILELTGGFRPLLTPFEPPLNLPLVSFKFYTAGPEDIGPYLDSLLDPNPEEENALQVLSHRSNLTLGETLTAHGSHLRSLSVKTLDSADAVHIAACTWLERFGMRSFPEAQILTDIPRSIVSLAIAGMPRSAADARALAEALNTFPRLKTLSWSNSSRHESVLAKACRRCRIDLRRSENEIIDDDEIELELRQKYIRI